MSEKHLTTGSTDVPLAKDKIRLYSMRFCPYAQRVHLVLNAKNIPHDTVNINLKAKPGWFLEKYPLGKVPAIVDGGECLFESLIVCNYLDEKYPENPLYPKDPMRKAQDQIVIDAFAKVITLVYKIFFQIENMEISLLYPVYDAMDFFEKELVKRGTTFFSGNKPGMVDYMIWPWCERIEMLKVLGGESFRMPKERFGKMFQWSTAMLEDEAVKKHYVTPEQHAKFLQAHRAGTVDYDNVL